MPVHLVAAYAVFWVCTFIFVLLLWGRQRRIERKLQRLEDQIERDRLSD